MALEFDALLAQTIEFKDELALHHAEMAKLHKYDGVSGNLIVAMQLAMIQSCIDSAGRAIVEARAVQEAGGDGTRPLLEMRVYVAARSNALAEALSEALAGSDDPEAQKMASDMQSHSDDATHAKDELAREVAKLRQKLQ